MSKRVISFGQFGGVDAGPQSHPWEDTGETWLNELEDAGNQDAAFSADSRQKTLRDLGTTSWHTGRPDTNPIMEGERRPQIYSGEQRVMDTQRGEPDAPRERPGINFKVTHAEDDLYQMPIPGRTPVPPRLEPVEHVFRGMSEDEFQEAKGRGYVQSDERGVISPGWEGTNAATSVASASYYRPAEGPSRIVKMAVHPDDGWFTSANDDYARTRQQIPWDRVVSHTSVLEGKKGTSFRQQVRERQKSERSSDA